MKHTKNTEGGDWREAMGSSCHRQDVAGFSMEKKMDMRESRRQHSAVKIANSKPNCSFCSAFVMFVTLVRAMLQTQHGVPKWTYHTSPDLINFNTALRVALLLKSYYPQKKMSISSNVRSPTFGQRFVKRADPEKNISRMTRARVPWLSSLARAL